MKSTLRALAHIIAATCVLMTASHASTPAADRLQQIWRDTIAHTPAPGEGCFNASYPLLVWRQVRCVTAPKSEFAQLHITGRGGRAGGGDDYAAKTKHLISIAAGFFPEVKNLKSEQGPGGANDFSLQLNSNFIPNDKACAGSSTPQYCQSWVQFVFVNQYQNAFMQYWLQYYNATCPTGWNAFPNSGDCWKNSALVAVPEQSIKQLPNLGMSGLAAANGNDMLVMSTKSQAYSITGKDSVMHLANNWHQAEFNVLGSGGAEATFNSGASVTDRIAVTAASNEVPSCTKKGGFTFETNNLALKKCAPVADSPPYVQFREVAPR